LCSCCQCRRPGPSLARTTRDICIWILATPISSVGHSKSKTSISNAHSISTFFTFDIVYRYRRYSILKVTLFDIKGDNPSISKVTKRTVDIEVSSLRYRTYILRLGYLTMISYTISKQSKAFLTFDIEGRVIKYRYQYRTI
jgi:hypothetical protein